jgi:hypothetical protein
MWTGRRHRRGRMPLRRVGGRVVVIDTTLRIGRGKGETKSECVQHSELWFECKPEEDRMTDVARGAGTDVDELAVRTCWSVCQVQPGGMS